MNFRVSHLFCRVNIQISHYRLRTKFLRTSIQRRAAWRESGIVLHAVHQSLFSSCKAKTSLEGLRFGISKPLLSHFLSMFTFTIHRHLQFCFRAAANVTVLNFWPELSSVYYFHVCIKLYQCALHIIQVTTCNISATYWGTRNLFQKKSLSTP